MMNNLHTYVHQDELLDELCSSITANLEEAIRIRGTAVLMVSGGSTPKKLFERLRQSPVAWEKVRIGLCDERWVDANHPDSNEKLVRDFLMQDQAVMAQFVGLFFEGMSANEAEAVCSQRVKHDLWPIDVCILGMGEDGHTASLFPNNPKLPDALDTNNEILCVAITPSTASHPRMSLTLQALLSAQHLYLHIEGEKKRQVYEEALKGNDMLELPIRAVLHQENKMIEVYYA